MGFFIDLAHEPALVTDNPFDCSLSRTFRVILFVYLLRKLYGHLMAQLRVFHPKLTILGCWGSSVPPLGVSGHTETFKNLILL